MKNMLCVIKPFNLSTIKLV